MLRLILACRWVEQEKSPPPMAFEILLDRFIPQGSLRLAVDALLAKKRVSAEVEDGPRIPEISTFLEGELARVELATPRLQDIDVDHERLDAFLRSALAYR